MKVRETRKRENQKGNELEVPCFVIIKVSEHIYVEVETIIKNLCGRLVREDTIYVKNRLFSYITLY